MAAKYPFFNILAFFALWALSVTGSIPVLLSWSCVEPEDKSGELTPEGRRLTLARALLTASCIIYWFCTVLGYTLSDSTSGQFNFWSNHAVILVVLLCLADLALLLAAVFSWQGRGRAKWILKIVTPIIALASIFATYVLCMATTSPPSSF